MSVIAEVNKILHKASVKPLNPKSKREISRGGKRDNWARESESALMGRLSVGTLGITRVFPSYMPFLEI